MALSLVTAPASEPITLAEAKAHLRLDTDDEDTLVEALISAAVQHVDGYAGILGRALITQTWDLVLDSFPAADEINPYAAIIVPLPPLQSVMSITYRDADDAAQTLNDDAYRVDAVSGRILLEAGHAWPSAAGTGGAVTVRFVAGYGDASSVPRPIRHALLLLVAHWFENRTPVNIGNIVNDLPMTVRALLAPYRASFFA